MRKKTGGFTAIRVSRKYSVNSVVVRSHERREPMERLADRDRAARLYALRGSPVTVAYAQVLKAAGALHGALESLLSTFDPDEAVRVLVAAGLRVPNEFDISQCWGGDTFEERHGDCKRMRHRVAAFIGQIEELKPVLPDGDPEDPCLAPLTASNAEGGAA